MSLEVLNKYFQSAKAVALTAGELIKEIFNQEKQIKTKDGFADLVTETDVKVEQLIISTLKTAYPDHAFIGEESVAAGQKINITDCPTWVIDPVDGTTNFVHSFPYVAISIGLLINKQTVVGIVYNPVLGEFFSAIRGHGSFCNDRQLRVRQTEELSLALVCSEFGSSRDPQIMEKRVSSLHNVIMKAHGIRSLGSAALNLCMVASGRADAYFEAGPHCWDFAAGTLIAEEAGGVIYDTRGDSFNLFGRQVLCATTTKLAKEIVALLDQPNYDCE